MPRRIALILLSIGAVVPARLVAQVAIPFGSGDRTESPYFEVDGRSGFDRLPLKDTSVDVHVSGVIASVVVRQTYENEGTLPLDATYVFPASTRAAVSGMRMRLGARVVEAVIRERKEARREFEKAKSEGKAAALLEEQRPNVFEMGVANILPGEQVEVELRYSEVIVPTDGVYEFVYPTVVGPRYVSLAERVGSDAPPTSATPPAVRDGHPDAEASAEGSWPAVPYTLPSEGAPSGFALRATVAAGLRIRELDVPSHRVETDWIGRTTVKVETEEAERGGGDRDFILRYRLADETVGSGLILQEGDDESFFTLLVEPPRRVTPRHVPPRELVFLLDVSGSMSGFPLETAKELLHDLVGALGPSDSFNVLLFAGASELMSGRSIAATVENVDHALAFVDRQRAGGGTELGSALERAMKLPRSGPASRSVVLITDGFVTAEAGAFRLVRDNLDRTNVFAFGIGASVNRFLVEGVARAGLGEPFVVTGPDEAAAAAERFRAYVSAPVLTDIALDFDGFEAYDVLPTAIPDAFADRPLVVQGKWRGHATGRVTISGVTGDGTYRHSFDVAELPAERSDALAHLWARTRVRDLSDGALNGRRDGNRDEIVALGLRYGLLTPYTSFVAVDRIVRTDRPGQDVDQPSPLPRGVEQELVGGRSLDVGPEPELWLLALMVLGLLALSRRLGGAAPVATRERRPRTPVPPGAPRVAHARRSSDA